MNGKGIRREIMIEIKVGDYVEMADGRTGYVTHAPFNFCNNSCIMVNLNGTEGYIFNIDGTDIKEVFQRIGVNDFTNKIEPLEEIVEVENVMGSITRKVLTTFELKRLPNSKELMDKINEIIEYINKEEE
jgi:hypothetical protein